jgi:hypothetical protein
MVKINWFLICLIVLSTTSCRFLIETYSDMYYTEEGGLRSFRKYKKYADLKDTLPPKLKGYRAYQSFMNYNINTQQNYYYYSKYFIVF